jgi:hypothetical protein
VRNSVPAIAAILLLSVAAFAQSPDIELQNGAFRVNGWKAPQSAPSAGWGTVFLVYAGAGKVPPLLGSWSVESGTLVFHPRYPVAPGVHYHAVFRTSSGAIITHDFDGPARATTPVAHVDKVYPSADTLPSNLLRLYIVFSTPMSRGEAAAHIHVEDDKGKVLPDELLPGQELWDPSFRRLTMTFDPGRIKRGLTSNQTIGPPITEGKHYKLVIDRDWPDANGVRMTEGFTKIFAGGPPDRTPPDPAQWRVTSPAKGTTSALLVDFPNPMNYSLLLRMIKVERITGHVEVARNETEWRFTPDTPWQPGDYHLVIDTGIEDIAGNHIGAAFDIDIFEKVSKNIDRKTVSIPFAVR